MIAGIVEDERKAKIVKKAHEQAQKILSDKIVPAFEKLIAEIGKLDEIEAYNRYCLKNDIKYLLEKIEKAARLDY